MVTYGMTYHGVLKPWSLRALCSLHEVRIFRNPEYYIADKNSYKFDNKVIQFVSYKYIFMRFIYSVSFHTQVTCDVNAIYNI